MAGKPDPVDFITSRKSHGDESVPKPAGGTSTDLSPLPILFLPAFREGPVIGLGLPLQLEVGSFLEPVPKGSFNDLAAGAISFCPQHGINLAEKLWTEGQRDFGFGRGW